MSEESQAAAAAPEPVPTEAPSPTDQATAAPPPAAAEPSASAAAPTPVVELTSEKPSLMEKIGEEKAVEPQAESPAEAKEPEPKVAETVAEPKPVEAKAEDKSEAETVPEAPKPEPVEYKYTLPETLKLDDTTRGEVHAAFDEFRANPVEGAQKLVDLHQKLMQQSADHLGREQHRVFNEMRGEWNKEIMADPVLGGAGHKTAMQAVARMRDFLVPKEMMAPRKFDDGSPRLSEFEEFLRITGAGDHRVFHRILHNAARYFDEPAQPPTEIKPPPDNGRRQAGRLRDLYNANR